MAAVKRKVQMPVGEDGDILEIMPIGAGSEVGRSCCLLKFKGKQVMFDCGVHPAHTGLASLPFFDEIDPSTVDLALITHFHLDHCAAVPYLTEKTNFKGRVFMTHPTKAIYKMLLSDFVRVGHSGADEALFDEADLQRSMDKIEQINYHQELEHNGIKFRCYNAGHVLGAAMFMVEIAGVKVLYTGDFSRHEDRHLCGAETPPVAPDVLIVESTYGTQVHEPRKEREARFTGWVYDTVRRGGRCLIPVFALGRAQELLLILDEFWQAHPELHRIPIYYASSLAKKCMTVYQTYISAMNDSIRAKFEVSNPFVFQFISNLKSMDHFEDSGPCVVMASPGMLQSGLSRELFEAWSGDEKNSCVLPGYVVEGTLGKHVLTEPAEFTGLDGRPRPLRMKVHSISFSAHSDFLQTSDFVESALPQYIVLVHGDGSEMQRLRTALLDKFRDKKLQVFTPKNCQPVHLTFRGEQIAKVVGSLASKAPRKDGDTVSGILLRKDFAHSIVSEGDLHAHSELHTSSILQRVAVPCRAPWAALVKAVEATYEVPETVARPDGPAMKIFKAVYITQASPEHVVVEWQGTPVADLVADSLIALVLRAETDPSALARMARCQEESDEDVLRTMRWVLSRIFGNVKLDIEKKKFLITVDGKHAVVDDETKEVACDDADLKEAVKNALRRCETVLYPLPEASCD